jgi:hypothetical protein
VHVHDVLDAALCGRDIRFVEPFDGSLGDELDEREVVFVGGAHECDATRGGDTPGRQCQAAEHCLSVLGIIDCREQRQRILDLSLLEESAAAGHLVRHAALAQGAHRRLHIDVLAEQPRDVGGSRPGCDEARTFARNRHCLAAFVGGLPHLDGRTGAAVGNEVLFDARGRARDGDDRARGRDDLVGAPIVVGEHELAVLRVLAREAVEVGAARSTELVDRLVVVSNHEQVAMTRNQRFHELGLRVVRVLVLVHHHVCDAVRDGAARRRLLADQAFGVEDAVVEIEDAGTPIAFVEPGVDASHIGVAFEDDPFGGILGRFKSHRRPRRVRIGCH